MIEEHRWHICDNKRYRMKELYNACGEMKSGMKFRQYCETSWHAGCVDIENHLLATAVQDQVKPSSTSNEKSNYGSRQIARTDSKWSTLQMVLIAVSSALMLDILQALFIRWWYGVFV